MAVHSAAGRDIILCSDLMTLWVREKALEKQALGMRQIHTGVIDIKKKKEWAHNFQSYTGF